jgi:hypothetical protein
MDFFLPKELARAVIKGGAANCQTHANFGAGCTIFGQR